MLLVFLYVRSSHLVSLLQAIWEPLGPGIIGYHRANLSLWVQGLFSQPNSEETFLPNTTLEPLKVEETATSYLNWSNFSVGSCNTGDGLPSPLPLIPRIVLHPLFPSVISSLFTCTSLVTGFWQCWSVTLKLLSFISDVLDNRINHLPEDFLGSGLFGPVLEPNSVKGSFLIPKLESE